MAEERFVPLHIRGTERHAEFGALYEGVPPWLAESLREWLRPTLSKTVGGRTYASEEMLRRLEVDFHLRDLPWPDADGILDEVLSWSVRRPEEFLSVLDWTLQLHSASDRFWGPYSKGLDLTLFRGGSLWRVTPFEGRPCLHRRVEAAVEDAVSAAIQLHPTAGEHLARAWHLAYGRSPNAPESYRASVKAVEAAAVPIITPDDKAATLGKMITAIAAKPQKWKVSIASEATPVETLRLMLQLLWQGNTSRHGHPDPAASRDETQREAETAVVLAATLVYWFLSGGVETL